MARWFLVLVLVVSGCGNGEDPASTTGWNLCERTPARVVQQPGRLVPDAQTQWGRLGPATWEPRTLGLAGGTPHVHASHEVARLTLPATAPRDRELRLDLRLPQASTDAAGGNDATVRLNGIELATLALTPARAAHRVAAPAAAWVEGDNLLEIALPWLIPTHGEGGELLPRGIALYGVEYDDPRVPRIDPGAALLELPAGTAVSYDVERVGPLDLRLVGRGRGTLTLRTQRVDRASGNVVEDLDTLAMDLEGSLDRRLPLPGWDSGLLRLGLAWSAPEGEAIRFESVQLVPRAPRPRPAVLLISIDTLAAKNLSLYGYPRPTTPHLEAFARDAVVFDACATNCPWTLPSFMSLLSGLYPGAHRLDVRGVHEPKLYERWFLADNRWTLAEALGGAGYDTAGFVDNGWLDERFGFTQGFEDFDDSAADLPHLDPDGGIRHVAEQALAWLDTRAEQAPWFLFLHAFDVHGPYGKDDAYRGRFGDRPIAGAEELLPTGGAVGAYGIVHEYVTEALYPPQDLPARLPAGEIVDAYDEGVARVDAALGELFDDLKGRGLYDGTLIVVTADHGETMGAGQLPFGHSVLDEEVLHVPLLVKLPGNGGAGTRVPDRVQLVDLYPTLLELVGLPEPGAHLHGRSLVPLLRGGSLPELATFAESGVMTQCSIQLGPWKLTRHVLGGESSPSTLLTWPEHPREWVAAHVPELVDAPLTTRTYARILERDAAAPFLAELRASVMDPVQTLRHVDGPGSDAVDLADRHPARVERLESLLEQHLARRDAARALARPPATPAALGPEEVEALRALGYAAGD